MTKTRVIQIRVTEEQDQELRRLAAKADLTVSDWVRASALTARLAVVNVGAFAAIAADRKDVRPVSLRVSGKKSRATREAEALLGKALR